MNSARTLWILMILILVLILGLRRSSGPADSLDAADAEGRRHTVPPTPSIGGPDGGREVPWGRFSKSGHDRRPRGPAELSEAEPTALEPDGTTDSPDLDSLVSALETAPTAEEQGLWADRIAAVGGVSAVEALFRLSLTRSSPEQAEALREAFKGLSTEEEMGALASRLLQTDDHDLIEAAVETLARGARSSTVEQLIHLHEEPTTSPLGRTVLGWAIERIRNPEAASALAELARRTDRPDLADAGIIALSALQAEALPERHQEPP
jgi:hypothetical protein